MASWRSSFALDLIADRDLIERLVGLQEEKRASDVIRTALREHLFGQPSMQEIMDEVKSVKVLILGMKGGHFASPPTTEPNAVDVDIDELENRLNATLSKFG